VACEIQFVCPLIENPPLPQLGPSEMALCLRNNFVEGCSLLGHLFSALNTTKSSLFPNLCLSPRLFPSSTLAIVFFQAFRIHLHPAFLLVKLFSLIVYNARFLAITAGFSSYRPPLGPIFSGKPLPLANTTLVLADINSSLPSILLGASQPN